MNGLIDRLPASWRDGLLSLAAAALAALLPWLESNYTGWNLPGPLVSVVGAVLPFAASWVTTLSLRYGYTGKTTALEPASVAHGTPAAS